MDVDYLADSALFDSVQYEAGVLRFLSDVISVVFLDYAGTPSAPLVIPYSAVIGLNVKKTRQLVIVVPSAAVSEFYEGHLKDDEGLQYTLPEGEIRLGFSFPSTQVQLLRGVLQLLQADLRLRSVWSRQQSEQQTRLSMPMGGFMPSEARAQSMMMAAPQHDALESLSPLRAASVSGLSLVQRVTASPIGQGEVPSFTVVERRSPSLHDNDTESQQTDDSGECMASLLSRRSEGQRPQQPKHQQQEPAPPARAVLVDVAANTSAVSAASAVQSKTPAACNRAKKEPKPRVGKAKAPAATQRKSVSGTGRLTAPPVIAGRPSTASIMRSMTRPQPSLMRDNNDDHTPSDDAPSDALAQSVLKQAQDLAKWRGRYRDANNELATLKHTVATATEQAMAKREKRSKDTKRRIAAVTVALHEAVSTAVANFAAALESFAEQERAEQQNELEALIAAIHYREAA